MKTFRKFALDHRGGYGGRCEEDPGHQGPTGAFEGGGWGSSSDEG